MTKQKKVDYVLVTGESGGVPDHSELIGYLKRMQDANDLVLVYGPQHTSKNIIDYSSRIIPHLKKDGLRDDSFFMNKLEKLTKEIEDEMPVFIGKIRIKNLENFKKAAKKIRQRHPELKMTYYQL